MLYHDRLETIDNSQSTNSAETLKIFEMQIARIYKALKLFADLPGPICYNDAQNKGMNLIVY